MCIFIAYSWHCESICLLTICPDCGGKLRERSGPYGRFYGCMNYPKCRDSRSIKK
ncbi:topoisomerase DNA-binding C4 zinc finger domain-containing protein [Waltera intestinalis]|nr:topoisomerase DNA-binding C4 zinc finger domain-containing protein [Bacillota bacterium]